MSFYRHGLLVATISPSLVGAPDWLPHFAGEFMANDWCITRIHDVGHTADSIEALIRGAGRISVAFRSAKGRFSRKGETLCRKLNSGLLLGVLLHAP